MHVRRTNLTLREFLDSWFDKKESRADQDPGSETSQSRRGRSKHAAYTSKRYRTIARLQIYPRIGEIPLTSLTGEMLDCLYDELERKGAIDGGPLSPTTVAQAHHIIHAALESAVRTKMLKTNVAKHLDPPTPTESQVEALESVDLERLIRGVASNPGLRRLYIPTLLAGILGMRRGEVLGLKWADVDFGKAELLVSRSLEAIRVARIAGEPATPARLEFKAPKSGKPRRLDVPAFVLEALRVHQIKQKEMRLAFRPEDRQDHDLVVCNADGSRWNPESFTPRFKAAAKTLGFPNLHFHVLRHTAISVLIKFGAHIKVCQEFAGHHSASFTLDRYGHVAPGLQKEAAARVNDLYAGLGQEVASSAV